VIGVWSLGVGVLLLGLLLFVGMKGLLTARDLEQESYVFPRDRVEPDTMELTERIFSPVDWTLIKGLRNPTLTELFRRERKAVALLWVRDTSQGIRQVMRRHAEAARGSRNLKVWTELKLFRQYLELRLTCGILYSAIQMGGPLWLRGLAIHAQELSQKIADAQANFRTAAGVRFSPQA
jgi:hypothetical protein